MTTKATIPGTKKCLAVEVRVVPGPDPGVDLPVLEVAAIHLLDQPRVQAVEDHHRVGDPDRGHVAHPAVGKDLDNGRLAPADAVAEVGGNLDPQVDLPRQEEPLQLAGGGGQVRDPEDPAPREGVGHQAALPGPCMIDQGYADVLDVVIDDVTEHQKLDERCDDEDRAVPLVAEELDELLADDLPDAQPAHLRAPPASGRGSWRLPTGETSPSGSRNLSRDRRTPGS